MNQVHTTTVIITAQRKYEVGISILLEMSLEIHQVKFLIAAMVV